MNATFVYGAGVVLTILLLFVAGLLAVFGLVRWAIGLVKTVDRMKARPEMRRAVATLDARRDGGQF